MNLDNLPPVPPTPKEFWEDRDWAYENLTEIEEKYPNLWVAVVDKQVIAAGKVIAKVRKIAEEKTGRKHFPVILAEKGIHVYKQFA
jgi:hypothetical protein